MPHFHLASPGVYKISHFKEAASRTAQQNAVAGRTGVVWTTIDVHINAEESFFDSMEAAFTAGPPSDAFLTAAATVYAYYLEPHLARYSYELMSLPEPTVQFTTGGSGREILFTFEVPQLAYGAAVAASQSPHPYGIPALDIR